MVQKHLQEFKPRCKCVNVELLKAPFFTLCYSFKINKTLLLGDYSLQILEKHRQFRLIFVSNINLKLSAAAMRNILSEL